MKVLLLHLVVLYSGVLIYAQPLSGIYTIGGINPDYVVIKNYLANHKFQCLKDMCHIAALGGYTNPN